MLTSYHVHSTWSDGKKSLEEMAEAAVEAGLDELGFSDHYVLPEDRKKLPWSMDPDKLSLYVEEVESLAEKFSDKIKIKLGLEVDYLRETAYEVKEIIKSFPFDYIIGSVHAVGDFTIDYKAGHWENLSQKEKDRIIKDYWELIKELAESGLCDFMAHMDLVKKFNIYPSCDISDEISKALDAISKNNLAFEVNTSGLYKPCKEIYPSMYIIKECFSRNIPVLINSDAHSPGEIIRSFDEAKKILKETGYKEAVTYEKRERFFYPL